MKFVLNEYRGDLTDEKIIEDIQQVATELNTDYISISTYKKNGKYSQTAIQGHFTTWKNALSIAGLRIERNKDELKRIKNEDYFKDLRNIADKLGQKTVFYRDYQEHGRYSCENIFLRYTTWDELLIAAGLQKTGLAKTKIDEELLLEEIERIWLLLGRQPTSTDIVKGGISKYSIDTFKRRFGGFRKALEIFIEYINQTDDVEGDIGTIEVEEIAGEKIDDWNHVEKIIHKSKHRTSRNINLRLRFKVFVRDSFKCCNCGSSPAKDPSTELHVDHITPWSNGGETVIDNLQLLCSKCNLGKSDLV